MNNRTVFDFDKLTAPEGFECDCGMNHKAGIGVLKVGTGVVNELPAALERLALKRPMLISGPYSFPAVGEKVCKVLEKAEIEYSLFVFEGEEGKKLCPDREAIEKIKESLDAACDCILCVGSGSMNDICKAAATELGLPQVTVGSAPSMDGYTSASSSLELNNTKATVAENAPVGVICDVELMAQAPMRLLWAGLGDIAAKTCSLCEWEMASMILGERYCPTTAQMVRQSYERSLSGAPGIPERKLDSVQAVIEGLLLSGVCMSYVNNSRPASGLEHYFSHCWEMMAIARGQEYDLHGIYVGIGTIITLRVLKKLMELRPDKAIAESAAAKFDSEAWETRLRRVFHDTAESFIELEKKLDKNGFEGRMARVERIVENWDRLLDIFEKAPDPDVLETQLKSSGMPTRAVEIGLTADDVADAFVCSRDTRDKYLTSSLIWDIGYMDEFEDFVRSLAV